MTGCSGVPEVSQELTQSYLDWLRVSSLDLYCRADALSALVHSVSGCSPVVIGDRVLTYLDAAAWRAAVELADTPRPPPPEPRLPVADAQRLLDAGRELRRSR